MKAGATVRLGAVQKGGHCALLEVIVWLVQGDILGQRVRLSHHRAAHKDNNGQPMATKHGGTSFTSLHR